MGLQISRLRVSRFKLSELPSSRERNARAKPLSLYTHIRGGSWVVTSGVISRVTIIIIRIRALITPLLSTHEPSSRP